MKKINLLFLYRLLFVVVGWGAFFHSFFVDFGHLVDFFSYFTIQSNLLIICWFTLAVLTNSQSRLGSFIRRPAVRGALTLYITVTMIVFFAILFKPNLGLDFITSYVLHLIIPLSYIIDWFIDRPRHKIKITTALCWLIYPIIFCIYSLIRGKFVGWYPYFFLSPIRMGSYERVDVMIAGLTVFFVVIMLIVYYLNNKLVQLKMRV
ncbi:MAG: Pr6Pr family membrane protein [Candidatus Saganbacteria bacterium]|nr:Pr6Pr family membrane protein [Candidatus Saganbacteria bacterium]